MKLHFEEEDLSERQECSALTSNLEGTALTSSLEVGFEGAPLELVHT